MGVGTLFPDANCFRHDVRMEDWERLGQYVVRRRVECGFKTRGDLAAAVQVSSRVLGDIEKGRRGNYDPVTIAGLESALDWESGSVRRIVEGGEPDVRASAPSAAGEAPPDEIELIYRSHSMTARQKLEAIRMVMQLRAQVEQEDRLADRDTTIRNES